MNRWKDPFPRNLYNQVLRYRNKEAKVDYHEFEENIDYIISGLTKHPDVIYAYFRDGIGFKDYANQIGANEALTRQCVDKFMRQCSYVVFKGLDYIERKKLAEKRDPKKVYEDSPIWMVKFPMGICRILRWSDIKKVSDLLNYSKSDILKIYGIGKIKANAIEEELAKHGFSLRQE